MNPHANPFNKFPDSLTFYVRAYRGVKGSACFTQELDTKAHKKYIIRLCFTEIKEKSAEAEEKCHPMEHLFTTFISFLLSVSSLFLLSLHHFFFPFSSFPFPRTHRQYKICTRRGETLAWLFNASSGALKPLTVCKGVWPCVLSV